MDTYIIFIYCLSDEILKANTCSDDFQCKMFTAEIMTFCLTASFYFGGNFAKARLFFLSHRYFKNVLSKSRLNRRIHMIPQSIWMQVIFICRSILENPKNQDYIVDSFPVAVCQTCRSWRCKMFSTREHHGYSASKKIYFWGIKVHMIVTSDGLPVEFFFSPGSVSDVKALQEFTYDFAEDSYIFGDKAYTDYKFEDFLSQFNINLIAERKVNATRQHSGAMRYLQKCRRKRIETVFSGITQLFPRAIHATTKQGFLLKLLLFIVAYTTSLFPVN